MTMAVIFRTIPIAFVHNSLKRVRGYNDESAAPQKSQRDVESEVNALARYQSTLLAKL
jgi:hypothetical protein